jgi:hypothetical protein
MNIDGRYETLITVSAVVEFGIGLLMWGGCRDESLHPRSTLWR